MAVASAFCVLLISSIFCLSLSLSHSASLRRFFSRVSWVVSGLPLDPRLLFFNCFCLFAHVISLGGVLTDLLVHSVSGIVHQFSPHLRLKSCPRNSRLDSEPGWEHYELRETWPYDPPLSPTGFIHAKENAKHFKTLRQKFDFVLSSPYLRCAQTACEMAKELNIPVHFDLDLGEVFDFRVPGDVGPQHRCVWDQTDITEFV